MHVEQGEADAAVFQLAQSTVEHLTAKGATIDERTARGIGTRASSPPPGERRPPSIELRLR